MFIGCHWFGIVIWSGLVTKTCTPKTYIVRDRTT